MAHTVTVVRRERSQDTFPFIKTYLFESGIGALKFVAEQTELLEMQGWKIQHKKDEKEFLKITLQNEGKRRTTIFMKIEKFD